MCQFSDIQHLQQGVATSARIASKCQLKHQALKVRAQGYRSSNHYSDLLPTANVLPLVTGSCPKYLGVLEAADYLRGCKACIAGELPGPLELLLLETWNR